MTTEKIAVFPGTFDPITKGHVDIVDRGSLLFDKVIVAVGMNSKKTTLFTLEKRMRWIQETFAHNVKVEVMSYEGLTVDFCRKVNANFILRGLRNGTDFDYESHIGQLNKALSEDIETIFVLSSPELSYISSTLVRDLIIHHGNYAPFLPEAVNMEEK
jgi:pantetheine-phosphate adenylyltransferase